MHSQTQLSHADAARVVYFIRARLEQEGRGAAVAVVDAHGELLAFLRTDGCKLPSISIAINKAYTAARERVESYDLGQSAKANGFPMTNFGQFGYVTWGGGVPILHDGEVIGAVGVSGLPEADDMVLARMGAALLSANEEDDE